MTDVDVTLWTDPACPVAFSAEPVRWKLRWLFGDQLTWTPRMIVLTREEGHAARLAEGAPSLQERFGMPIDPSPYEREASSEPACRAVVATRLYAPEKAEPLLRALRVRVMAGGLVDDPALLASAAEEAGLDDGELESWTHTPECGAELERDVEAAHDPSVRARALDHKLGGAPGRRRYSAPSYEFRAGDLTAAVPGLNPAAVYENALANLAPGLSRRSGPDTAAEILTWADTPLATAEVAELLGRSLGEARDELSGVAEEHPAGADAYWTPR